VRLGHGQMVTVLGAARVASRQERAMNPVEIAALDALDLLVVVDNESDKLSNSLKIGYLLGS
jgi:hypothetical protein